MEVTGDQCGGGVLGPVRDLNLNRRRMWKQGDGGGTVDTKCHGSRSAGCRKGLDVKFGEWEKSMKTPT